MLNDPAMNAVEVAMGAEKALENFIRIRGESTESVATACDGLLTQAYETTPTTPGGIAALARLWLDIEHPDPVLFSLLSSIERGALALQTQA